MLRSNLRVCVSSCRLADRHPGAAGGRRYVNPCGLFGGPDFPLPGDAEKALPHSGCVPLHRRYVRLLPFLLLSNPKTPEIIRTFLPRVDDLHGAPTHHAHAHLERERRHIQAPPQPQQFPYRQGVFCSSADIKWKGRRGKEAAEKRLLVELIFSAVWRLGSCPAHGPRKSSHRICRSEVTAGKEKATADSSHSAVSYLDCTPPACLVRKIHISTPMRVDLSMKPIIKTKG